MEHNSDRLPLRPMDPASLAAGRRLACRRFPRRERHRLQVLAVSVSGGLVLVLALAVVLQRVASVERVPGVAAAVLACLLALLIVLLVVVPFAAEGWSRLRAWRDARCAHRELWRQVDRAVADDPEAVAVLQAFLATVSTDEFDHVAASEAAARFLAVTSESVGAVSGLTWMALLGPERARPKDPLDVLELARVVETDPAFPFVLALVGAEGDLAPAGLERSLRAARSCRRAAQLGVPTDMVLVLASEWDGTLDDFDVALELLASGRSVDR